jgi:2-C-methyl-D-erythritol 4-phosphate cytidylyltransferase
VTQRAPVSRAGARQQARTPAFTAVRPSRHVTGAHWRPTPSAATLGHAVARSGCRIVRTAAGAAGEAPSATSLPDRSVSVVLLAGGVGKRMGAAIPKQYLELKGQPIATHSLQRFARMREVFEIIIVCDPSWRHIFEERMGGLPAHIAIKWALPGTERQDSVSNGLQQVRVQRGPTPWPLPRTCAGGLLLLRLRLRAWGEGQQRSTPAVVVVAGRSHGPRCPPPPNASCLPPPPRRRWPQVGADALVAAIHDSARPLITLEDAARCMLDGHNVGAAVLGVAVKPTIKEVDPATGGVQPAPAAALLPRWNEARRPPTRSAWHPVLACSAQGRAAPPAPPHNRFQGMGCRRTMPAGMVTRTLQRSKLWEVQTPQCIRPDLLRQGFKLVAEQGLEVGGHRQGGGSSSGHGCNAAAAAVAAAAAGGAVPARVQADCAHSSGSGQRGGRPALTCRALVARPSARGITALPATHVHGPATSPPAPCLLPPHYPGLPASPSGQGRPAQLALCSAPPCGMHPRRCR